MSRQDDKSTDGSTMSAGARAAGPDAGDRRCRPAGADGAVIADCLPSPAQIAPFYRERAVEPQAHPKRPGASGVSAASEDGSAPTRASLYHRGAASETLARF